MFPEFPHEKAEEQKIWSLDMKTQKSTFGG